jgi:hypothetical protein
MKVGSIILLVIFALGVFILGRKLLNNIKTNTVQKVQLEKFEKKIDSMFLDNRNLILTLAKEKDSIYVEVKKNIYNLNTIITEVDSYIIPQKNDEIIKELKRLSK